MDAHRNGTLYVVATPIGNMEDITLRALRVLRDVDLVAAEDTRHTRRLLTAHGIETRLISLHDHNESERIQLIIDRLQSGESIALVSDAGTPLISDPGYRLVREVRAAGLNVSPVPGACAAIAGLSVAGLPTDAFRFAGFLPARSSVRQDALRRLEALDCTLVIYESPHRIAETLDDMVRVLGGKREAVLARELTKTFETILSGTLDSLVERLAEDADQQRGEFVLMVAPSPPRHQDLDPSLLALLDVLVEELPLKRAAKLVAAWTGLPKQLIYSAGVERRDAADEDR